MARDVKNYYVFIASPGDLGEERNEFKECLRSFNEAFEPHFDIAFCPVGWEGTPSGPGSQSRIERDLRRCDFVVVVFSARVGSPTDTDNKSGTLSEWRLARELYREGVVSDIAIYFKDVKELIVDGAGRHLVNEMARQLSGVLEFREELEREKQFLYKRYSLTPEFIEYLNCHLARWASVHLVLSNVELLAKKAMKFGSVNQVDDEIECYNDALFALDKISHHTIKSYRSLAVTLLAKGRRLRASERVEEALPVFNRLVHEFRHAEQVSLRKVAADGLKEKGVSFKQESKVAEEIAVYKEAVEWLERDPALAGEFAEALLNLGSALLSSSAEIVDESESAHRGWEGIIALNRVGRFYDSSDPTLLELAVRASLRKAKHFRARNLLDDEVNACDEVIHGLRTRRNLALREKIVEALEKKKSLVIRAGDFDRILQVCDEITEITKDWREVSFINVYLDACIVKSRLFLREGLREDAERLGRHVMEVVSSRDRLSLRSYMDTAEKIIMAAQDDAADVLSDTLDDLITGV